MKFLIVLIITTLVSASPMQNLAKQLKYKNELLSEILKKEMMLARLSEYKKLMEGNESGLSALTDNISKVDVASKIKEDLNKRIQVKQKSVHILKASIDEKLKGESYAHFKSQIKVYNKLDEFTELDSSLFMESLFQEFIKLAIEKQQDSFKASLEFMNRVGKKMTENLDKYRQSVADFITLNLVDFVVESSHLSDNEIFKQITTWLASNLIELDLKTLESIKL